jgi:NADPH:quinone reductase
MRAVVIDRHGGPEVLEIRDVPTPQPYADQVLVRVHASALNRADLLQRRGKYPAPAGAPQDIPGLEFAGEVVGCGPEVTQWKPGQRVFGITGGGAQAEYLLTHERILAEIPDNLSWEEAAAVPEAFITAHDALWTQAQLRPGERVLIHAVGSGVGLAAVQLVRALSAEAFGTARTQSKLDEANRYGLQKGYLVSSGEDVPSAVGSQRFNVVLELVGGSYVASDLQVLAPKGRLLLVGTMGGAQADLNLGLILSKRLRIIGTVLRSRPLEEKIEATQRFAREVVPLFATRKLRPSIDRTYSLREIQEAHAYMEENQNTGKIVIRI